MLHIHIFTLPRKREAVSFCPVPCCFPFHGPGFWLLSWSWSCCLLSAVLFRTDFCLFPCTFVRVYSITYTYPYVYVCDLILFLSWSWSRLLTLGPVSLCTVMLSAVAVSVLAVSCPVLFPFPLQNVYSCCRCRYVLVPCPRSLITSDHNCSRSQFVILFTAVCIRTFSVTKRSGSRPCLWSCLWSWSQLTVLGLILVWSWFGLMYSNYDDYLRRLAIHKTNTIVFR